MCARKFYNTLRARLSPALNSRLSRVATPNKGLKAGERAIDCDGCAATL